MRHCCCDAVVPRVQDYYFSKEDERLMRKLLGKLKKHADTNEPHVAEGTTTTEASMLQSIVGKYKMSEADFQGALRCHPAAPRMRCECGRPVPCVCVVCVAVTIVVPDVWPSARPCARMEHVCVARA